jgi:UDP-GlcNAc:undecaprenyl-phosphate GlcNAc-1-phosphate transferase
LWSQKSATLLGMTAPLMALAVPLIDTGVAVARRWMSGKPIFGADRGHVHHMLLKKGWTQRRAVLALYGVSGVCAGLSLVTSAGGEQMAGAALLVFCLAAWTGLQFLGYAEFGAAGRMFRPGTFRKAVGAHVVLKSGEERLKASQNGEEQYAALEWMCRELGFAGVRLEKDGLAWGGMWQERECWRVEMEPRTGVKVTLWHVFGPNGPAPVVAPLAEMVKGVFGGVAVEEGEALEGGAAAQEA